MAFPKLNRSWLPIIISLSLVLGIGIGMRLSEGSSNSLVPISNNSKIYELGRVEEVLRFIESHYVDSIDIEKLKSAAIAGILSELDPHSVYIPKEKYPDIKDEMKGHFVGIGIMARIINNKVFIQRVREHSPADSIGLLPGDRLISIDGINLMGEIAYDSLNLQLKGAPNTKLNLGIERANDSTLSYSIVRKDIIVNNVSAALALNDSIGYIKIDRFATNTYHDFMTAFEGLQAENVNELIIDVRGNTGGYLNETAKIVSQFFLQKDIPIAWSDGVNAKKQEYVTTGKLFYQIKDVVILVDENSASASEILAGSVQDLSRGLILGRRTFGKGLVQEQYDLSDGSAFRLTIARYYLPSGRSIQRSYTDKEKYKNDWSYRIENGELLQAKKIPSLDTTVFRTRLGRSVYAKRGVVPDLYVPYSAVRLEQNWEWLDYVIDDYTTLNTALLKDSFNIQANLESMNDVNWIELKNMVLNDLMIDHPDMLTYFNRIDSTSENELVIEIQNSLAYSLFNNNEYNRFILQKDQFINLAFHILEADSALILLQSE